MTISLNAGASLLLKLGTSSQDKTRIFAVGGSMACYGLAFLTYFVCLRNYPVSVAYPVMTGGVIVTIVLVSSLLLGESITTVKVFGTAMVIIGGAVLLRS